MRKILFYIAAIVITFSVVSCTKDDGPIGPQGEKGEKGEKGDKGDEGNADVKSYSFSVLAEDWDDGAHSGNQNSSNSFDITPEMTGGINISDRGYVVLAYAAVNATNISFSHRRQLPYTFGVNNSYGIRFELAVNRYELRMSKTTNGWDSNVVPLSQRPSKVNFDIVMIKIGVINSLNGSLDLNDYEAVREYFDLN